MVYIFNENKMAFIIIVTPLPKRFRNRANSAHGASYLIMASVPKGCQTPNYTLAPIYHYYSYPPSAFGTETIQRLVQVTY